MRRLFRRPPRRALGLLLGLDAIPGALDAGGRDIAVLVAEHMRVAADHLSRDRLDHVAERKGVLLLGHAGVIDHLQQEIAEFVAEVVEIAARDRVGDLIGFLDGVGRDRRKILLEVPRAAGDGRAQRRHDLDEAVNVAGRGHGISVAWENEPLYAASGGPIPAERAGIEPVSTDWPDGPGMLMGPA